MKRQVIQVAGTVRSGTTLTGLILSNSIGGMALGEIFHLFYPSSELHWKTKEEWKKKEKWNVILSDRPERLYENIFHCFPEVNVITDSSKNPFWFKIHGKLRNRNFDIRSIVTYKKPQELKKSFKKRGLKNWQKSYMGYYRKYFSLFNPTLTVHINTFLTNCECLSKICDYFGLKKSTDRLRYWEYEHPNFFGSPTIKKNKIEIMEDKPNSNVMLDSHEELVYNFLRNHDICSMFFNGNADFPDSLKYGPLKLKTLEIKNEVYRKMKHALSMITRPQKTDSVS